MPIDRSTALFALVASFTALSPRLARADADASRPLVASPVECELGGGLLFAGAPGAAVALGVHAAVASRWSLGVTAAGAGFSYSERYLTTQDVAPTVGLPPPRLDALFMGDLGLRYHALQSGIAEGWLGAGAGVGAASLSSASTRVGPHVGGTGGIDLFPGSLASFGFRTQFGGLFVRTPETSATWLPEVYVGAALILRTGRDEAKTVALAGPPHRAR